MNTIEIDGSAGEGGGQILRSALTLSMVTGTPFRINGIRAKRKKPGLLRQHLTAVLASAEICGATLEGAVLGSQQLSFAPGPIKAGDYRFAIGTAGSCTLVLQTIMPALWFAQGDSSIRIGGGTHNPAAPPADFLIQVWLPLMQQIGASMTIELLRHGFYPAGGGDMLVQVAPMLNAQSIHIDQRGDPIACRATSVVAGLSQDIATRELACLETLMDGVTSTTRSRPSSEGPGNALLLELEFLTHREMFSAYGERGVTSEQVARKVAKDAKDFLSSSATVGEYLADQLVLAMALGRGGSFVTSHLSSHLSSNLDVIQRFVPIRCETSSQNDAVRVSIDC